MRKKYLSALLFGALLVTSAGTFTSCKDYDDDINNLQEQINEIKTTLSELEDQIGTAGVSSVTFDEATGVLTVVDGNGTKSYTIQTSAEVEIDATISEDGVLTINGKEIGKVFDGGDTVTVDEDNNLVVNDKIVASLGGGNAVTMVKDEANKTVTIKVGDETVTLPYGTDTSVTPVVEGVNTLNTYEVSWGVAANDITFGETKIAAGKLLLGGMSDPIIPNLAVKPVTYDLSAQTLKLVDMDGKEAPVEVVAVPATWAEATTGSRAADVDGKWNIYLSMLESVTEENVATAFTKEVNGVDSNLKYALTINGIRSTGYYFVIDTQTENESKANVKINDKAYDTKDASVKTGDNTLSLGSFDIDASEIVASYLKVENVTTEALGVKADGMTVSVPTSCAGRSDIALTLYVLDVTGNTSKHTVNVNVKATTSSTVETVSPVAVKVTTDNKFTIDLGTIFQNLDANIVLNISGAKLTSADKNFFALTKDANDKATNVVAEASIAATQNIQFIKSNNSAITDKTELRSAVKAVVTLPLDGNDYVTGATDIANIYGAFNLNLTLTDNDNNVLKTIVVPVTVSKPEFSDYYTENSYAGWSNGTVKHVVTSVTSASLSNQLFNINKKSDGQTPMITTGQPSYKVTYTDYDGAKKENQDFGNLESLKIAKKEGNVYDLKVSSLTAKASKDVVSVKLTEANGTVASTATNISVEKSFTLNLVSMFADVKVVYFTNNVAGDKAIVVDKLIAGYANTAGEDEPANYNGLAFQYGNEKVAVKANAAGDDTYKLNGFALKSAETTSAATDGEVLYSVAKGESSLGGTPALAATGRGGVTIEDLNAGEGGKLTFTFVDEAGIRTKASIDYVKQ